MISQRLLLMTCSLIVWNFEMGSVKGQNDLCQQIQTTYFQECPSNPASTQCLALLDQLNQRCEERPPCGTILTASFQTCIAPGQLCNGFEIPSSRCNGFERCCQASFVTSRLNTPPAQPLMPVQLATTSTSTTTKTPTTTTPSTTTTTMTTASTSTTTSTTPGTTIDPSTVLTVEACNMIGGVCDTGDQGCARNGRTQVFICLLAIPCCV